MVTLMRTNEKENEILGKILAEKANESLSPVAFLFPLEGISILDGVNQPFCDWKTDKILFESIRKNVKEGIAGERLWKIRNWTIWLYCI